VNASEHFFHKIHNVLSRAWGWGLFAVRLFLCFKSTPSNVCKRRRTTTTTTATTAAAGTIVVVMLQIVPNDSAENTCPQPEQQQAYCFVLVYYVREGPIPACYTKRSLCSSCFLQNPVVLSYLNPPGPLRSSPLRSPRACVRTVLSLGMDASS
jgi:hypothetical protein